MLLDFDGPVCSVFAGWPAADVSRNIRDQLLAEGIPLSKSGLVADDPLDLLRDAAKQSRAGGTMCEKLLAAAELVCVDSASPTPGVGQLLEVMRSRTVPVAIVSNNSEGAVRRYLQGADMLSYVTFLSTRPPLDPRLMKPDPHLLATALMALKIAPESAVMIGDTLGDIQASRAAGVISLAYVNRPDKLAELQKGRPDAIVTSLWDLA